MFAVAAFRGWSLLNLLGFTFTFVITALWRATAYRPEWFASFEFFLLLFFAMYVAVTVLSARSGPKRGVVSGSLSFGLPAIVLSLQASLVVDFEHGLAISAAGFGSFYLLVAAALLRSGRVNNCLHIAAASGNDDHDTFHRSHFTSAGLGSVCENGTDFAQREFQRAGMVAAD